MDVEPQNTVNDIRCKVEHLMPGPLTRASKLYFNNNDVLEFIPEPTHHDLVLDYMYIGRPIMVDSIVCKNPTLSHFNVVSGSTLYVREPLLCEFMIIMSCVTLMVPYMSYNCRSVPISNPHPMQ